AEGGGLVDWVGASGPDTSSPRVCPGGRARRPWPWPPLATRHGEAAQRYRHAPPKGWDESGPWTYGPVRARSPTDRPGHPRDAGPSLRADCLGLCEGRCTTTQRHDRSSTSQAPRVECNQCPNGPHARPEPAWPCRLRCPSAVLRDESSSRGAQAVRRADAEASPGQRAWPPHEDVCGDDDRDGPRTQPET